MLHQNVKGMKRFYNYLKREEEREAWEREANPEDIEYVKCQEELNEQLQEQVTHVERIIGELTVCQPQYWIVVQPLPHIILSSNDLVPL